MSRNIFRRRRGKGEMDHLPVLCAAFQERCAYPIWPFVAGFASAHVFSCPPFIVNVADNGRISHVAEIFLPPDTIFPL